MKTKNYACTVVFLAFISVFFILMIILPAKDYSENEKRVLADLPELSLTSASDGSYTSGLENYINDHFPMRDTFVGIYSYYNRLLGRGNASGVYLLSDGSLVAAPQETDLAKCERNVSRLEKLTDKTALPSTLIIVPSPGKANEGALPFGHGEYADDKIYDTAYNTLEDVSIIDLRELFSEKEASLEDVYYRTDHHITSYGSYLAYLEFCKARGLDPTDNFTVEKIEDFYGTAYSKSGLWLTKPDTLEIWHSENGYSFTVTVDDITEKKTSDSLYFYEHGENMDKYPIFLDGNHAITTIKNNNVNNGKTLLVVKDSYAHCLSTFLCDQYETVCLVDMRYYRKSVSALASEIGATELLYVFGAENLASLSELALLG